MLSGATSRDFFEWNTLGTHPGRRGQTHERPEGNALDPALPASSPHNEQKEEGGTAARDATVPEGGSLSLSALREESSAAWRDAQDVARAAHASDPSVLDAGP